MLKWLILVAGLVPACATAGEVAGLWRTAPLEDGARLHVRLGTCGYDTGRVCGQIVEAGDPGAEALVGRTILTGLRPAGPNRWVDGQVWIPDDDRVHAARAALDGADRLSVQACLALVCRGQVWTRLE